MKNRTLFGIIFIVCAVSLYISLNIFYNQGIFVDEYNLSPDIVLGGEKWVYLDWARLFLLALGCMFSGIGFIKSLKKSS